VEPGQRDDPTPCADYAVGELVDHIVGWARSFAARLRGGEPDVPPNDYRVDYRAGGDPARELHEAADAVLAAYRSASPAAEQLPVGILVSEFLTHGWDLARATGQELAVEPAAAELGLATVRGMLKPDYRGPGMSFGPEVEVDPSAPALERLVGFVGRDPGWLAPA
jgi:uncharacterized protein (TIGR03086 family)